MLKNLIDFFRAPIFIEEEKNLQARLVNVLVLAVFFGLPLMFIGNLLDPTPSIYIYAMSLIGFPLALWVRTLLHHGRLQAASRLWITLSCLIVTLSATQLGTVQATNTAIFLVNIVVAGLLLGWQAILIVTIYNSLAVLGLVLAQENKLLVIDPSLVNAGLSTWVYYTTVFAIMAMIMMVSNQVLKEYILRSVFELNERGKTEKSLRYSDSILKAVNFAAQEFLQASNWRHQIPGVLKRFGEATQASHVYIFEKHFLTDGTLVLSQRYEWVAAGIEPDLQDADFQNIDLQELNSEPWYLALGRGEACSGNLSNFSASESKYFSARGLKAIIEAPIMVDGKWWGVIGLDDYKNIRYWLPMEIDAIKTVASTLGAAIQRQRNEMTLLQRNAIMQAATFAAQRFLQSSHWQDEIHAVLEQLGKATDSSHVYIFENHFLADGTHVTSQRFEWVAHGIPPDIDNPLYQNMPIISPNTERWHNTMLAREAFYGNIESLTPAEREIYISRNLLTFLDVPILVNGEWWGILGYDDYLRVREWSPIEVEAIKIAASTLGATIERQLKEETIRENESRHRAELEQKVQERTRQLQEALLEIEGVSYTASHDLRAPLRAVNGYVSILLDEYHHKLDTQQTDYLHRIKSSSQRMGNLLDDLIRLIRYSRQSLKLEQVDLSVLAARVEGYLREKYTQHPVETYIQPGLMVQGDAALLLVLLEELLDNAWKFTESNPQPRITLGEELLDGQRVFFVRDNGIGMEMKYSGRLFRNFEQLYAPGEVEGTGMGLAMVQRIIQRHHGRVWAESSPNQGATLYFTLPD